MDKLVVFRKTYEYMFWLKPTVERFAKVHKYSLGAEMQDSVLAVLKLIIRANFAADKERHINDAIVEHEVHRVLLRLGVEYKLLSPRQFAHASRRWDEVARLLRGWQKAEKE